MPIDMKFVCGICGDTEEDDRTGCCSNGHDHWVQRSDFDDPQLARYVKESADRLGITVDELKARVS